MGGVGGGDANIPPCLFAYSLNRVPPKRSYWSLSSPCWALDERYPRFQDFFDERVLWGEVLGGEGDDFEFTADGEGDGANFVLVVHTVADEDVGDEGKVNIAPFVGISPRVTAEEDSFLDGDIALLQRLQVVVEGGFYFSWELNHV